MSDASESNTSESSLSRIPFTSDDEANIQGLAWWLRASGIVTLVTAALGLAEMFRSRNFSNILGLALMTACAILSIQAAGYFYKVATTNEADQDYLLGGFRKLRLSYLLLSIWIIIGLVALCAILLFAVVAAIIFASK